MGRNGVEVGWYVGEEHWNEPDLPLPRVQPRPPVDRLRNDLIHLARSAVLALVFLSLAASTSYSAFEREYREVWLAIDGLLDQEHRALVSGDRALYYSLVADPRSVFNSSGWFDLQMVRTDARSEIQFELLGVEMGEDLLRASVRVTPPRDHWVPEPYVEERFYRLADGQWLRESIPYAEWGEPRRLDTTLLSFEYLASDEEPIRAVVTDLEERYVKLRREMGLSDPPWRTLFRVQPAFSRWSSSAGYRAFITSPGLVQLPAGARPADQIGDAAATVLASRVVGDVLGVYELYHMGGWYDVSIGMRNWYLDEYFDRQPYWLVSGEEALRSELPHIYPIRLDQLTGSDRIESRHRYLRFAATTALAHFIADEYGSEKVFAMLQTMPETEAWDEMIPAIFGKPVYTFETEWNLDLARRLGVDLDLP